MKLKLTAIVFTALALSSCKKDQECECTTVYYDQQQIYVGSDDQTYLVKDHTECHSYNSQSATEVTNCHIDN